MLGIRPEWRLQVGGQMQVWPWPNARDRYGPKGGAGGFGLGGRGGGIHGGGADMLRYRGGGGERAMMMGEAETSN